MPGWIDGTRDRLAELEIRVAELETERDALRAAGDALAKASRRHLTFGRCASSVAGALRAWAELGEQA